MSAYPVPNATGHVDECECESMDFVCAVCADWQTEEMTA